MRSGTTDGVSGHGGIPFDSAPPCRGRPPGRRHATRRPLRPHHRRTVKRDGSPQRSTILEAQARIELARTGFAGRPPRQRTAPRFLRGPSRIRTCDGPGFVGRRSVPLSYGAVPRTGFEPAISRVKAGCPDHWTNGAWYVRRDSNPHRPAPEAGASPVGLRTHKSRSGDSNPVLLGGSQPPYRFGLCDLVDRRDLETRTPACKAGVMPFHHQPMVLRCGVVKMRGPDFGRGKEKAAGTDPGGLWNAPRRGSSRSRSGQRAAQRRRSEVVTPFLLQGGGCAVHGLAFLTWRADPFPPLVW